MAARRLCGHGFKNLGFFGYENVCWSDGRLEGFRETLREEFHIDDIHIFTDRQLSSMWSYDISELQRWLYALPRPIAIFACDDNQAEILLETCQASGINVPMEVATWRWPSSGWTTTKSPAT